MFLSRHHEDSDHKETGDEHLNEDSLRIVDTLRRESATYACVSRSKSAHNWGDVLRREGIRCKALDDGGCRDTADKLSDGIQNEAHWTDDPRDEKREADVGVEKPSCDAVEQPDRDQQTETEACSNVHDALYIGPIL